MVARLFLDGLFVFRLDGFFGDPLLVLLAAFLTCSLDFGVLDGLAKVVLPSVFVAGLEGLDVDIFTNFMKVNELLYMVYSYAKFNCNNTALNLKV